LESQRRAEMATQQTDVVHSHASSNSVTDGLCSRCDNLQLESHIGRSMPVFGEIATISKWSLRTGCSLCRQFRGAFDLTRSIEQSAFVLSCQPLNLDIGGSHCDDVYLHVFFDRQPFTRSDDRVLEFRLFPMHGAFTPSSHVETVSEPKDGVIRPIAQVVPSRAEFGL